MEVGDCHVFSPVSPVTHL